MEFPTKAAEIDVPIVKKIVRKKRASLGVVFLCWAVQWCFTLGGLLHDLHVILETKHQVSM